MEANLTKPASDALDVVTKPVSRLSHFVRGTVKYLLGKGIVSLAVLGATLGAPAAGVGALLSPAMAVAGGFLAWKIYRQIDGYQGYKKEMLNIYRTEIAERIGIPEQKVTMGHLQQVAKGDPVLGIRPNTVIAEALKRERESGVISVITAAVSALATFGMLQWGLDDKVGDWFTSQFPQYGDVLQKAGVSVVSAVSGLVLHNGLDGAIGGAMGHYSMLAHDRIRIVSRQRMFGKSVSPEQVFDVFLAANPEVFDQVNRAFNKGLPIFSAQEKAQAMKAIGIDGMIENMTKAINAGKLNPAKLAFLLDTSQIEQTMQQANEVSKERLQMRAQEKEAKKTAGQSKASDSTQTPAPPATQSSSTRFRDMVNRPSVARDMSFTESENLRRAAAANNPERS